MFAKAFTQHLAAMVEIGLGARGLRMRLEHIVCRFCLRLGSHLHRPQSRKRGGDIGIAVFFHGRFNVKIEHERRKMAALRRIEHANVYQAARKRRFNAIDRRIAPCGSFCIFQLVARKKRIHINSRERVIEARQTIGNFGAYECAHQLVSANHGIEVRLPGGFGRAMGNQFGKTSGSFARLGLTVGIFEGIETLQTCAGTIGQHAFRAILKQVFALNALNYFVVRFTLRAQVGDDAHFSKKELLSSERPPPDAISRLCHEELLYSRRWLRWRQ